MKKENKKELRTLQKKNKFYFVCFTIEKSQKNTTN